MPFSCGVSPMLSYPEVRGPAFLNALFNIATSATLPRENAIKVSSRHDTVCVLSFACKISI